MDEHGSEQEAAGEGGGTSAGNSEPEGGGSSGDGSAAGVDLGSWPELDVTDVDLRLLFASVCAADPSRVGEEEALGGVQAITRLARFLEAREARFLTRACGSVMAPDAAEPRSGPEFTDIELTTAEVAPMQALSKAEAMAKVATACSLVEDLPKLVALVETGQVGLRHAQAVESQLREVVTPDNPIWDDVQDHLASILPGRTRRQAAADTRRAIDRADPTAAARRAQKAERGRRVETESLPDGMGAITATLTATTTRLVDTVLDALADGCRDQSAAAGRPDPRTHQQRRADAFGAVFTAIAYGTALPIVPDPEARSEPRESGEARHEAPDGAGSTEPGHQTAGHRPGCDNTAQGGDTETYEWDRTWFGGRTERVGAQLSPSEGADEVISSSGLLGWWYPPALPTQQGRRPHLTVIMSEASLNGETDDPAELSGYGPIPAALARELADEAATTNAIVLPTGTHPSEAASTDRSTPDDSSGNGSRSNDQRGEAARNTRRSPVNPAGPTGPAGSANPASPAGPAGPDGPDGPDGPVNPAGSGDAAPSKSSSAKPRRTTRRRRKTTPAWTFAGHGPGDQESCPKQDRPYRAEQTLTDAVIGLHQTCRHPGCQRVAERCDHDHVRPYQQGGTTCLCNLLPLCRFHHRLKTYGGWRVRFTAEDEPYPKGTVEWISRKRQRYYVLPPVHPGSNAARPVVRTAVPEAGFDDGVTDGPDNYVDPTDADRAYRATLRDWRWQNSQARRHRNAPAPFPRPAEPMTASEPMTPAEPTTPSESMTPSEPEPVTNKRTDDPWATVPPERAAFGSEHEYYECIRFGPFGRPPF